MPRQFWASLAPASSPPPMFNRWFMPTVADFKNSLGIWAKTDANNNSTNAYQIWMDTRKRCKVGGKLQELQPTYIGCTMSEEFNNFYFFAEWCQSQIGYGLDKYQIDKDILVNGNKEYCKERCVFVPQALNKFAAPRNRSTNGYPQGVHLYTHQKTDKFVAEIAIDGKGKSLGYFLTAEDAYAIYKSAKNAEAKRWYQRLKTCEFAVDQRVIAAMEVWVLL